MRYARTAITSKIIEPLVSSTLRALTTGVWRCRRQLIYSCQKELCRRLCEVAEQPIAWHFAAFKAAYCAVHGDSSLRAIHRAFLRPNSPARLLELTAQYPELGRLLTLLISNWRRNITEILTRLDLDRGAIARRLLASRTPGKAREICMGLSDPHRGGRTVALVWLENGIIIYKPRPGHGEHEWSAILRWLNNNGFRPGLRSAKVLPRNGYCWMEYISAFPCRTNWQRKQYVRRSGALLCVSYLTKAIDCHTNNVIGAGAYPILVDAEALWHPVARRLLYSRSIDHDGLLRTGWLPFENRVGRKRYNISSLKSFDLKGSHITADGRTFVDDYSEDLIEGFATAWRLLLGTRRSRKLFAHRLGRLSRLRWRQIVRPTVYYAAITKASLQIGLLRSSKSRLHFLEDCCKHAGVGSRVSRREALQLAQLDIPYFMARRRCKRGKIPDANSLAEVLSRIRLILHCADGGGSGGGGIGSGIVGGTGIGD
jgi:lantibiotic modifying enzyme